MSTGALLELVRGSIASMDAATAAGNCDALHALFIRALDCRQQRPVSLQNIDIVEGAAVGECPCLIWLAGVGAVGVLEEGWEWRSVHVPAVAVLGMQRPASLPSVVAGEIRCHLVVLVCQLLLLVPSSVLPACWASVLWGEPAASAGLVPLCQPCVHVPCSPADWLTF